MSPDVVDAKGKTRQMPVLKPTPKAEVEHETEADTDLDVSLWSDRRKRSRQPR
jgi:hypothetical protein